MPDLHRVFATAIGASRDDNEIARLLDEVLQEARSAHPGIEVDEDAFVAHLATRVDPADPVAALRSLRVADLYLTFACAVGSEVALAHFETDYLARLPGSLARLRGASDLTQVIVQTVRERLLVTKDGGTPAILEYAGRGSLLGWVRTTGFRIGIDLLRKGKREVLRDDDVLADLALPAGDVELEMMRDKYSLELREALKQALLALDRQTRTELRLYYIEKVKLEELAGLFSVAPSTMSRRLAKARHQILEETRRLIRERCAIGETEVDSILRIVGSRLELSMSPLANTSTIDSPSPERKVVKKT